MVVIGENRDGSKPRVETTALTSVHQIQNGLQNGGQNGGLNGGPNGGQNGGPNGGQNAQILSGVSGICRSLRKKRDGDQMPIGHFEFWYDAIERDDVELVWNVLESVSAEERRTLVDGRFLYNCKPHHPASSKEVPGLPCAFQRPLVLAAVFTATKTVALFLEKSADLFVQDIGSNTVIHGIIKAAAQKPSLQEHYVAMYDFLLRGLNGRQKQRLLYFEDADGLRPLELAARLRTFVLFQRIFDTEGVYLFKNGILGAHLCQWYDVTDYESWDHGKRRALSPLRMLIALEKEFLAHAKQSGLVSHPAIKKWTTWKIQTNVPYLVCWFFIRSLYTVLIFICAVADDTEVKLSITTFANGSTAEVSHEKCPKPLLLMQTTTILILKILVMFVSFVIILYDSVELVIYWLIRRRYDMKCYHTFSSEKFVVRTRFYRLCNFLLAASVLIFHLTRFLDAKSVISYKAYMLANILNIWSLLFFIQLLPALGYFVTIIQRMMKDMFHFLILYVILFFSFSQTFFNLFYVNQVCSADFPDIFWSMYSTFKVMLNMVEVTDGFQNPSDIAILHTTYVIVVPILLVNFLIALMSNSVSDVAENRQIIMLLQRLSAAILVESRMGKVIPFVYKLQQRRYYIFKEDRIYVECFVMKKVDSNSVHST